MERGRENYREMRVSSLQLTASKYPTISQVGKLGFTGG